MMPTCALFEHVTNAFDPRIESVRWLAGIIGENPSKYAKSPSIWNPVLQTIGLCALYITFDVPAKNLVGFVYSVRLDVLIKGLFLYLSF